MVGVGVRVMMVKVRYCIGLRLGGRGRSRVIGAEMGVGVYQ